MNNSDVTILFLSCDKYSDLWKPLFHCVEIFWKDCPYPMFLGSNTKKFSHSKIRTLLSGVDKDWSSSLLIILSQIKTQYVFLWLDDIFPIGVVDTNLIGKALNFMKTQNGIHMHALPVPQPDRFKNSFGVYDEGAPYRVTSMGLWQVQGLKKILLSGESPWNFEIMGSYRSRYTNGFFCSMYPWFKRLHVVEKGKIFREAYEYCKKHNIPLDESSRSVLSGNNFLRSEIQKMYFNTMLKIPWKIRLTWMNIFRKLLISY